MHAATSRGHSASPRRGRPISIWKTIGYMLLMGVIFTWLAALAYPLAIRMGLTEHAASKVPNYAFFVGLTFGLGLGLSRSFKHVFKMFAAMVAMCCVFWFYGVVVEAVLHAMGVPARVVEWISPIAFCFGIALSLFVVYIITADKIEVFLSRRRGRRGQGIPG